MYQIRQETPADYDGVYHLVQDSFFATASHSDGTEQDLVVALRKRPDFLPALSLVAEESGQLIGHILMTPVGLGSHRAVIVAPLAVLPGRQGTGVGGALLQAAHSRALELGFTFSVLVGHETYYPRFGYRPAAELGIRAPFAVPAENFMALHLPGGGERADAFLECPAELLS